MRASPLRVLAAAAMAGAAGMAFATDDVTSVSYISYLERYATVKPTHEEQPLEAVVNMPVLSGDRVETSRGARLEIQLADGCTVWLDEFSVVDFDAIVGSRDDPASRTALFLAQGSAAIEIPPNALGEQSLRFETNLGETLLERSGLYRLALDGTGLRVEAHAGLAELPAGIGSVLLRAGQEAWIDGRGDVDKNQLQAGLDDFWAWVEARRRAVAPGSSAEHVDGAVSSRAWVLDGYGEWVYLTSNSSWMWRPRVAAGWVPYSYGRWYWTPVGWSWISYEPWGWMPYHYGTWYWDVGFGWVWGWDPIWASAWVHWFHYPGYVGWCPRGYYDGWYYGNCHGCGHGNHHHPTSWREAALDFSGRVRLRDVDPRPWTFVRSESFASNRLDRVRIEPSRLLRELPGDGFAQVRSGPLVTPSAGRSGVGRSVEASLRGAVGQGELPDLSTIVRRDAGSASLLGTLPVRSMRTADTQVPPRTTSTEGQPGTPSAGRVPSVGRGDPGTVGSAGPTPPRSAPGSSGSSSGGSVRVPVRTTPARTAGQGSVNPTTPARGDGQTGVAPGRAVPPRTVSTQPAPPVRPQVQRGTTRSPETSAPAAPKARAETPSTPAEPPPPPTTSARRSVSVARSARPATGGISPRTPSDSLRRMTRTESTSQSYRAPRAVTSPVQARSVSRRDAPATVQRPSSSSPRVQAPPSPSAGHTATARSAPAASSPSSRQASPGTGSRPSRPRSDD